MVLLSEYGPVAVVTPRHSGFHRKVMRIVWVMRKKPLEEKCELDAFPSIGLERINYSLM